jgi:DNA-binding NarL/FixJ family response regulator
LGGFLVYIRYSKNEELSSRQAAKGNHKLEEYTVRILLADDQPKVRSALRILLGQQPEVEVVGDVGEVESLLDQLDKARPDLILLDWELPGLSSNGRLSKLREHNPGMKVIVLSGRPEVRRAALAAGADAFVSKVEPPTRLLGILRDIASGIPDAMLSFNQGISEAGEKAGT